MTNEQRDELLISIVKSLNNLQNSFNEFRAEIKAELNEKINALGEKLNARLDSVESRLDSIEARLDSSEITLKDVVIENQEIKKYVYDNEKGLVEIVKDFSKHNSEVDQHLKNTMRKLKN